MAISPQVRNSEKPSTKEIKIAPMNFANSEFSGVRLSPAGRFSKISSDEICAKSVSRHLCRVEFVARMRNSSTQFVVTSCVCDINVLRA